MGTGNHGSRLNYEQEDGHISWPTHSVTNSNPDCSFELRTWVELKPC
jgi:hypothetical protein